MEVLRRFRWSVVIVWTRIGFIHITSPQCSIIGRFPVKNRFFCFRPFFNFYIERLNLYLTINDSIHTLYFHFELRLSCILCWVITINVQCRNLLGIEFEAFGRNRNDKRDDLIWLIACLFDGTESNKPKINEFGKWSLPKDKNKISRRS